MNELEKIIKSRLSDRGFSEETLLNNIGLICATIDELIKEVTTEIPDLSNVVSSIELCKCSIDYTPCCTELKADKKAKINKLNDLLKNTEDDEGLKLNNPIEWARRVGYLEGKINYICNL